MLRRTALLAVLALPLSGCVTYQVVDRGGFYELQDGLRHVPGHRGHGEYFVHPGTHGTLRVIDRWAVSPWDAGPWGYGPSSRWSWSSHVGWGWGSPRWAGSLGWGWHSPPHWGPGWRRGWAGPGTVWVVPSPPPRPVGERPMPKPRPLLIDTPQAFPAPVLRDGPRQGGEARFEEPRHFEEPTPRFEEPRRFEEPTPRFEAPASRAPEPAVFHEPIE